MRKTPRFLACAAVACLAIAGCEKKQAASPSEGQPAASVTLRVVVAEDAQLANAISRLRGEWGEQSGGEMQVVQAVGDPNGEQFPAADLIVFPSRRLGELCEAGSLRPMRPSALASEVFDAADLFPAVRDHLMVYGQRVMALPLGCPVPLLAWNDEGPPVASWDEVSERFSKFGAWAGELPSSAYPRRGYLLIACAACYGGSNSSALLFDAPSMKPRLTEPAMVRAATEIAALFALPAEQPPDLSGLASLPRQKAAVLWPMRNVAASNWDAARVAPLPGATEVYDRLEHEWRSVDGAPRRVALLGTSGRLIGVTAASRNAASAFRLAAWLAGSQNAPQLSRASPGVAACRLSTGRVPDDWIAGRQPVVGKQVSAALVDSLNSGRVWQVPRIIGVDRYLAALDEAVVAIAGGEVAESALAVASGKWEALTDEIGRDRQRLAYRRHLGIDRYDPPKR